MFTTILILAAILIVVGMVFGLTTTNPPGPLDANLQAEGAITKTASYNGAALDLGAGFTPGGCGLPMAAVLLITAADGTSSDETYTFKLEESADNSSFTACSQTISWTRGTTGNLTVPGFVSQRYVRSVLTAGGTTPSITYTTYIQPIGRPG